MEVPNLPALALSLGPCNALGGDVDTDAQLLRMCLGKRRQVMAMAAPDLPDKRCLWGNDLAQQMGERLPPLFDQRQALRQAVWPQADGSPSLLASMATIRRLMSVGFTPLIRLACPSVRGLI